MRVSVSMSHLSIQSTVKGKLPSLPFLHMKEAVLGADYELSLVFVGRCRMRTLNRTYRNIDRATDILSFPLDKKSGEIFLYADKARAYAKKFDRTPDEHLAFLFIHGLLHLKGLDHGSRMEREEKKFSSFFTNVKKNSSRHRYRNLPN